MGLEYSWVWSQSIIFERSDQEVYYILLSIAAVMRKIPSLQTKHILHLKAFIPALG